jgi:hypothetical protein
MRTRTRRSLPAAACLLIGVVLAAAGCGGNGNGGQAAQGVFVGKVSGTDAYIALISDGSKLGGYLCDGKKTSSWLATAELSGGKAQLKSRAAAPLGSAELSADRASGEVRVAGASHPFSAEPATGKAGLYRQAKGTIGKPGFTETGWIVLADGSVRGATSFKTTIKTAPSSISGTQLGTNVFGGGNPF